MIPNTPPIKVDHHFRSVTRNDKKVFISITEILNTEIISANVFASMVVALFIIIAIKPLTKCDLVEKKDAHFLFNLAVTLPLMRE